jgi:hypothetical protein
VCPLSVLSNWQTQLEEHTAGNLQVLMSFGDTTRQNDVLSVDDHRV